MDERRERGHVPVNRHDPAPPTLAAHGYDAFLLQEDDDNQLHNALLLHTLASALLERVPLVATKGTHCVRLRVH